MREKIDENGQQVDRDRVAITENRPPAGSSGKAWKIRLVRNFKRWVGEVDSWPIPRDTVPEPPDLYSFYEELCILRGEVRKDARRNHDAFTRFNDALSDFHTMVKPLTPSARQIKKEDSKQDPVDGASHRELFMSLVELLERVKRIEIKLSKPPETGFFSSRKKWLAEWKTLLQGIVIMRDHFEQLLRGHGVTAIHTLSRPFDPAYMKAVEVVASRSIEPNTVVEESAGGYLYNDQVIKFAEVKVAG